MFPTDPNSPGGPDRSESLRRGHAAAASAPAPADVAQAERGRPVPLAGRRSGS